MLDGDWSSDVCSSDLLIPNFRALPQVFRFDAVSISGSDVKRKEEQPAIIETFLDIQQTLQSAQQTNIPLISAIDNP
jgi:hypothetical protein